MKSFEELDGLIEGWANNKSLIKYENRFKQFEKIEEEIAETKKAMIQLEILEEAYDFFCKDSDNSTPEEVELIKFLAAKISDTIQEIEDGIGDSIITLSIFAKQNFTSALKCLNLAWDEIKDRTGKTVGGTFIKD